MRATNKYGHVFNMPVFVCKTSTHHTRKNEATCHTNENLDNPAFIARQDGLLQEKRNPIPAADHSLSVDAAADVALTCP